LGFSSFFGFTLSNTFIRAGFASQHEVFPSFVCYFRKSHLREKPKPMEKPKPSSQKTKPTELAEKPTYQPKSQPTN